MTTLFLLLAACTGGAVDLEKPATLPDLGDPFVGIYAAAAPGTFRTDCEITVDLYEGDTLVASSEMEARGSEWTGTLLPGEVQYRAVATWDTCTTGPEGSGTFESSVFSGVKGDFFLFRYTGVTAAFDSLVQREDFDGGEVEVTFVEGTTLEDAEEIAATHGLTAEAVSGTTYRMTWDSEMAVGKALTLLSTESEYSEASPSWIRTPDWW